MKEELTLKAGYLKQLKALKRDAEHSGPFLSAVAITGA